MADLIVAMPASWWAEREYVVRVVLGTWLGLSVDLVQGPEGAVAIGAAGSARRVVIPDHLFGSSQEGWETAPVATGDGRDVGEVEVLRADGSLATLSMPRLLPRRSQVGDALDMADGDVTLLGHDVFGVAFYLIAGCEDHLCRGRDAYGRQPFAGSLLDVTGLIERPVVDELVDHLWLALKKAFPGLERRAAAYSVWPTHDVDYLLSWSAGSLRQGARSILGDLARRRSAPLALRRARSRLTHPRAMDGLDPYDTYAFLMRTSEDAGLRSSFFFLVGGPSPVDHVNDLVAGGAPRLFTRIRSHGHDVGLHGSAAATTQPDLLVRHLAALRAVAGESDDDRWDWGGRQHFLTWSAPATWRAWADAGLVYDSSVAFIERVGFRAGTCRPYPVFDIGRREQLPLVERPLIVHDATLRGVMGASGDDALRIVHRLADRCRESGGLLTLLWHNSSFPSRADREWYTELLHDIAG